MNLDQEQRRRRNRCYSNFKLLTVDFFLKMEKSTADIPRRIYSGFYLLGVKLTIYRLSRGGSWIRIDKKKKDPMNINKV